MHLSAWNTIFFFSFFIDLKIEGLISKEQSYVLSSCFLPTSDTSTLLIFRNICLIFTEPSTTKFEICKLWLNKNWSSFDNTPLGTPKKKKKRGSFFVQDVKLYTLCFISLFANINFHSKANPCRWCGCQGVLQSLLRLTTWWCRIISYISPRGGEEQSRDPEPSQPISRHAQDLCWHRQRQLLVRDSCWHQQPVPSQALCSSHAGLWQENGLVRV